MGHPDLCKPKKGSKASDKSVRPTRTLLIHIVRQETGP